MVDVLLLISESRSCIVDDDFERVERLRNLVRLGEVVEDVQLS